MERSVGYLKKFFMKIVDSIQMVYNSKYFTLVMFAGYFFTVMLSYIKYPLNNLVPASGDGLLLFYFSDFTKDAISHGEFPLWNALLSNGIPFVSDVTMSTFYPFKYLTLFLPKQWFWLVFYSLHLALGATFTYKYLNEIQCNRVASLLTSIVYLFSIHLGGGRKSHLQLIVCTVYLPIILYYIERYLRSQKKRYLLYSAIFMALQFFEGFPQYMVYTDLTVGFYLIAGGIRKKIPFKKWFKDAFTWGISYFGLIMVQLLLFIQLTLYYVLSGVEDTSFEVFCSFSLHPFRFIMMLFPKLFEGQPWNYELGSSEVNIEVFLGTLIVVVLLYGIRYYYKERKVWGPLCVMLVTAIYAGNGCIEKLATVLYKIPLIKTFRVPSRILFVFIFFAYVLFAVSLTKIMEEQRKSRLLKHICGLMGLSVILMTVHISCLLMLNTSGNFYAEYQSIFGIYWRTIVVLGITAVCIKLMDLDYKNKQKIFRYGLLSALLLVHIFEIYPYWKASDPTDWTVEKQLIEKGRILQIDANGYKVMVANPNIDATYQSVFTGNRNMSSGISTLNSYISVNNPRLTKLMTSEMIVSPQYNYSGLYAGFAQLRRNLLCQNDLLSMLGVKYIIDQENILSEAGYVYEQGELEKEICAITEETLVGNVERMLLVPFIIESETYYEIAFHVEADKELKLIGDLYENSYDNLDQDFSVHIKPGLTEYRTTIFSGEMETDLEGYFRMWLPTGDELNLQDLTITAYHSNRVEGVYKLYYEDETMKIYENKNVNEVMYAPERVEKIADENQLYIDTIGLDLDKISYCSDIEMGYENNVNDTVISDIVQKTNSVTAQISCPEKTFITYSQNYFPGWKAYVDGQKVDIHVVNGLIQGIEVPAGNHEIRFEYVPTLLYVGMAISLLTLAGILIFVRKEKRKG